MDSEAMSAEEQDATLPSPGAMLKQAREAQQLTVQQIADKLYLKAEQIQAIEGDVIDSGTSLTFAKGYVKLYAKHVGVDETRVIEAFEFYHAIPETPAKLQSFSRKVANQAQDDRWMMVTYAILAVIVAGVVIWWFQQSSDESLFSPITSAIESQDAAQNDGTDNSVETVPETLSPAQPVLSPSSSSNNVDNQTASEPAAADVVSQLSQVSEADTPIDSDDADISTVERDATSGEDEPTLSDSSLDNQSTSLSPADAPVTVVFTFSEDCWVNIEDATGNRIAYGIKNAGYVMTVPGYPPFSVTLGAPQVVSIDYEGERVDMSEFAAGRTARFTLPLQD